MLEINVAQLAQRSAYLVEKLAAGGKPPDRPERSFGFPQISDDAIMVILLESLSREPGWAFYLQMYYGVHILTLKQYLPLALHRLIASEAHQRQRVALFPDQHTAIIFTPDHYTYYDREVGDAVKAYYAREFPNYRFVTYPEN